VNIKLDGDTESKAPEAYGFEVVLYLFESFDTNKDVEFQKEYSVSYSYFIDSYDVYLIKYVKTAEGGYDHHYWNGTAFDFPVSNPYSIGDISGGIIQANVPLAAFQIPSSLTYYAVARSRENNTGAPFYMDFAPDNFQWESIIDNTDGDTNGDTNGDTDGETNGGDKIIFGYNLFLCLSALIGVSFIFIEKSYKKRR